MADLHDRSKDSRPTGPESPPRAPRWVKVSAIIALVAIVLIAALLLFGGGDHGPGRHSSLPDVGTASPAVTDGAGHRRPEAGH
jgi:hypothetical protein